MLNRNYLKFKGKKLIALRKSKWNRFIKKKGKFKNLRLNNSNRQSSYPKFD